jgi:hypothetical protein
VAQANIPNRSIAHRFRTFFRSRTLGKMAAERKGFAVDIDGNPNDRMRGGPARNEASRRDDLPPSAKVPASSRRGFFWCVHGGTAPRWNGVSRHGS